MTMKSKDDLIAGLCRQVERLQKSEQKAKDRLEKTLSKLKKQGEQFEAKFTKKVSQVQKQFKSEIEKQVLKGIERNAQAIARLAEKVEKKSAAQLKKRKAKAKSKK